MNWYRKIKIAEALWSPIGKDRSFEDHLIAYYEAEYLYHKCLNSFGKDIIWNKRMSNIVNNLKKKLLTEMDYLKNILQELFGGYLRAHSSDPLESFESRYGEYDFNDESIFSSTIIQFFGKIEEAYSKYKNINLIGKINRFVLSEIFNNINKFDSLNRISIKKSSEIADEIIAEIEAYGWERLSNSGIYIFKMSDTLKELLNATFEDDTKAIEWINANRLNLITIKEYLDYLRNRYSEYTTDYALFRKIEEIVTDNGEEESFIRELYINIVFPVWIERWNAEGLGEKKEIIEKANNGINSIKSFSDFKTKINMAIQIVHMSGNILDHLERYTSSYSRFVNFFGTEKGIKSIQNLMTDLSNGKYIDKWNKKLEENGIKI